MDKEDIIKDIRILLLNYSVILEEIEFSRNQVVDMIDIIFNNIENEKEVDGIFNFFHELWILIKDYDNLMIKSMNQIKLIQYYFNKLILR